MSSRMMRSLKPKTKTNKATQAEVATSMSISKIALSKKIKKHFLRIIPILRNVLSDFMGLCPISKKNSTNNRKYA